MTSDERAKYEGLKAEVDLRFDEPMSAHTTFRIGGPADVWVEAQDRESLARVVVFCSKAGIPWWVLGRGSNVLVSDQGLRGVMIHLGGEFCEISVHGERLAAGGAALLDDIAEACVAAGLCGAEFLAGIPGTVGGGLGTNAGAFGRSLSDVVERVTVMDEKGELAELSGDELSSEYRRPVVKRGLVAVHVLFRLKPGKAESLAEIRARRQARQPAGFSAGSFFRNPIRSGTKPQMDTDEHGSSSEPGHRSSVGVNRRTSAVTSGIRVPAGQLIDECGLKGRTVGRVQVSERHANFIVNTGGARFCEVYELVQLVKANVEEQTGIVLEEEVQVLA